MKAWEPIVSKIYPAGQNGAQPNFSTEDLEKMKNDPRFAEMFKNMSAGNTTSTSNDDVVDAEVVD